MDCDRDSARCRADLAGLFSLVPNPRSLGDYEGRCPECGHGGFGLSAPTKNRSLRHIWKCNCQRCRCPAGDIRAAMLKAGAGMACLGDYDGPAKSIDEEAARKLERIVRDILSVPGLKPAEVRIALAEGLGRKVPTEYGEFVTFAMDAGVGRSQAYEAAKRNCA